VFEQTSLTEKLSVGLNQVVETAHFTLQFAQLNQVFLKSTNKKTRYSIVSSEDLTITSSPKISDVGFFIS